MQEAVHRRVRLRGISRSGVCLIWRTAFQKQTGRHSPVSAVARCLTEQTASGRSHLPQWVDTRRSGSRYDRAEACRSSASEKRLFCGLRKGLPNGSPSILIQPHDPRSAIASAEAMANPVPKEGHGRPVLRALWVSDGGVSLIRPRVTRQRRPSRYGPGKKQDPVDEETTLPCALSHPATAAFDQATACAPRPAAVALTGELARDRHSVRALRDRSLHSSGSRYTAVDIDILSRD